VRSSEEDIHPLTDNDAATGNRGKILLLIKKVSDEIGSTKNRRGYVQPEVKVRVIIFVSRLMNDLQIRCLSFLVQFCIILF